MKEFTEKELAQHNGKNGNPAYIGYKGKVYDVSASFLWKDGVHQVIHNASVDLTDTLDKVPHGKVFIEKFPVVRWIKF